MLTTEEEAKSKRCQEGFGTPLSDQPMMIAGAGAALMTSPINCIGSACMAWRWQRTREWDVDTQTGRVLFPAVGYCGKAGEP